MKASEEGSVAERDTIHHEALEPCEVLERVGEGLGWLGAKVKDRAREREPDDG